MIKDVNCFLEGDINTCPHYDRVNCMCRDNVRECGMFNKNYMNPKNEYVRKPRWYEKYYRANSFIR